MATLVPNSVRIGAASNDRDNAGDTQFGAFLDRPLHAIEFEDGEQQRDVGDGGCGNFFPQFELDSALLDSHDASMADYGAGGDIEFLTDAGSQDADEMIGVFVGEGGMVARDFIGDPSAAGHGDRGCVVNRGARGLFFRPDGADRFVVAKPHGLRRGLHSFAASRLRPDHLRRAALGYPKMSFILPSSERSMGWLSIFESASSSCSNSFWRLLSLVGI